MKSKGSKIKVVADIHIPFLKGALEDVGEVVYLPGKDINADDLKDADALITRTRTRCDESLLAESSVKFIAAASIGYDHIDTEYCDSRGIEWTNAPGCNSGSVEQYILSVLQAVAGRYEFNLNDKTIGIVGVGHVGSRIQRICGAMGMKVLLNDPPRERDEGPEGFVDISVIQHEADIITFHVPLNRSGEDKTHYMADEEFFGELKKNPVLINSSRGAVVDGEAMKQALESRKLSAGILDVWQGEPNIDLELLSKVDIATPHIAGYSVDGKANATGMSVRALSRKFSLGLDDWQPSGMPGPGFDNFIVDGSRFSLQELIYIISRRAYDVLRDDDVLRKDPAKFEQLRATYPVRREPGAIRVNIINDLEGAGPVLQQLGYHTRTDHCDEII